MIHKTETNCTSRKIQYTEGFDLQKKSIFYEILAPFVRNERLN